MDTQLIQTPDLIFGAATVIITIALMILNSSWMLLMKMLLSLPDDKRKIRFTLRGITDLREKDKREYILMHLFAIIFLAAAVALALFSVLAVSSDMLGTGLGFHTQEDYQFGKICLSGSILFLFLGFLALGLNWGIRIIALIKGAPDPLTTDLAKLKPLEESVIEKRRKLDKRFFWAFMLVMGVAFLLSLFNLFEDWQKALITIGAVVLYLAIMSLIDKIKYKPKGVKTS